jgi:lipopolysaccharide export system protein LptC
MLTERLQRLREWLVILPLLLLLGATYWLNQQVHPLLLKPDAKKRHDPDFVISQFSATTLNAQGLPRYTLAAQKMLHFPDDDSTQLTNLRLVSQSVKQPPMYTTAKQGEISSRGDEVFLNDEVKIVRSADATRNEMTVTTSYLHALPELGLMDTNRPVTLKDGHNTLYAVGMKIDNQTRIIKLLAQVRSQHEISRN